MEPKLLKKIEIYATWDVVDKERSVVTVRSGGNYKEMVITDDQYSKEIMLIAIEKCLKELIID